jgi:hypothetical protein
MGSDRRLRLSIGKILFVRYDQDGAVGEGASTRKCKLNAL